MILSLWETNEMSCPQPEQQGTRLCDKPMPWIVAFAFPGADGFPDRTYKQ